MELSDAIYDFITEQVEIAEAHMEEERYTDALKYYAKALEAVPEPKTDWPAATWLLASMGDACFLSDQFQEGQQYLSHAMHCPDAIGNPFIHLRLGQCQYELGNLEQAADELTRAYAIEGEEIFESDHPKYLDFLSTRIDLA